MLLPVRVEQTLLSDSLLMPARPEPRYWLVRAVLKCWCSPAFESGRALACCWQQVVALVEV